MLSDLNSADFCNCMDETLLDAEGETSGLVRQEFHPEREILFALEGSCEFTFNGFQRTCSKGDVFFINSNIPHQLGYRSIKTDFSHIWVHLHPKRFFAMLYQLNARTPLRSCRSWEFSLALLEIINTRWDQALRSLRPLRLEIYQSIARIIAEELKFAASAAPQLPPEQYDIVEWIKKHISLNCGCNSSLEELEQLTGYNRCHLMRKFKNKCGMTIGEYINTIRRSYAAGAATHMRQKEIAARLGFKSAAAFWLWQNRDKKRNSSK